MEDSNLNFDIWIFLSRSQFSVAFRVDGVSPSYSQWQRSCCCGDHSVGKLGPGRVCAVGGSTAALSCIWRVTNFRWKSFSFGALIDIDNPTLGPSSIFTWHTLQQRGSPLENGEIGTPGSSCASAASGKDQELQSWWPRPRTVDRNIRHVKFTLLLVWCSWLCFSCCVCGVCMWKFLLCDDNGEAYDVNLLLYEVDGGFYDIGDHLAGYKLAYDGPG